LYTRNRYSIWVDWVDKACRTYTMLFVNIFDLGLVTVPPHNTWYSPNDSPASLSSPSSIWHRSTQIRRLYWMPQLMFDIELCWLQSQMQWPGIGNWHGSMHTMINILFWICQLLVIQIVSKSQIQIDSSDLCLFTHNHA